MVARIAHTLRVWWNAQKARNNYGEFAQAVVRVNIGLALLCYFIWIDWGTHAWVRPLFLGFLVYTLVLFGWTYRARESSDLVRFLSLAVDMGLSTILLGFTGETSAVLVFVYTWIAVGYGFRFGLRYLHAAWVIGLVAFSAAYAISAAVNGFWYQHPLVWVGAFIWIAAPTFYVARLLKQRLVAVQAAEEARVQMERARADVERERVERARAEAERARAEAEAASEAKSEFLATMSHEMRTPLNGVVGAAEMLAAKDLPNRERQLVDWLLASSRQLRSLIDNLLDLRKIEAGKMAIEQCPFDLHALMNRLAALFEPEAKRTHLRLTKSVSVDAPYLLVGDDARIQQVLINLTANALKFTREGFVRVSVSALEQEKDKVELRFEVRDTGIGIAPESAGRVFDRFTQADPGIHREYGGSGLGTTICKYLVELMGGAIGFDSLPGKGTTFWFTVPLSRQAETGESGLGGSAEELRLLISPGRPAVHKWLAKFAQEERLPCTVFLSIEEALITARKHDDGRRCVMIVDGEDDRVQWREVPSAVKRANTPFSCFLIRADADEAAAFDAGYACLLKSRDPLLLARAIRSVLAGDSPLRPLEESADQPIPGRTGLDVLVAEDNQISQQIIAMMLQAGGHRVTPVNDGESALERCESTSFDVIILDMHMPGRTGLDVAKAIRLLEIEQERARTPIIMLSAAATTDLRDDSLGAGVDSFVSKPVDPHALLREVGQVFARRERSESSASAIQDGGKGYIDRVLLRDMAALAGGLRLAGVLTTNFSRDALQLIDKIDSALMRKDHRQFRELTHALKGTAMMAGAIRLGDSAARMENIADSDFASASADWVGELRAILETTNRELCEWSLEVSDL